MRRRAFIGLKVGLAAPWPFMAHAQKQRVPTIGVLVVANPEPSTSERPACANLDIARGKLLKLSFALLKASRIGWRAG